MDAQGGLLIDKIKPASQSVDLDPARLPRDDYLSDPYRKWRPMKLIKISWGRSLVEKDRDILLNKVQAEKKLSDSNDIANSNDAHDGYGRGRKLLQDEFPKSADVKPLDVDLYGAIQNIAGITYEKKINTAKTLPSFPFAGGSATIAIGEFKSFFKISTGFYQKKLGWEGPHYCTAEVGGLLELSAKVTWFKQDWESYVWSVPRGWGQYTNYYFKVQSGLTGEVKGSLKGALSFRSFKDAKQNGKSAGITGGAGLTAKAEASGEIGISYKIYTAHSVLGPYYLSDQGWTDWHGKLGANLNVNANIGEGLAAFVRRGPYLIDNIEQDKIQLDFSCTGFKFWYGGEINFEIGSRKWKANYYRDANFTQGYHRGISYYLFRASSG